MKEELSFLNKSFGLSVQVAYGRMDGKNIKMIDHDKRRSETAIAYLGSLCRRKGN